MSNIKIQDVYQRRQYTATSGQTVFSVPFPFFEDSDLTVWKNETELTLSTDYTVSGAGSPSGGSVTLSSGATSGDIVTIQGLMPIDRTSIYSPTISNLTGSDLNNDFNRDIVMAKQLETTQELLQLQYKPYVEISQDESVTTDRWLPLLQAGQVWRKNTTGTAIEAVDFDDVADAPADAYYYLGTADGQLPNGRDLSALADGLLKHSVSGGISTPARAIPATDYWAPGNDLTTPNPPGNGDDVVNKTYVDALVTGATWLHSVRVASTSNFSSTYDNGTAGIGATLTASSNGAASVDGVSLSLNDRVLFKNQTNAFENGIYYVSQVGDGSNPAIYTRSEDFDQPGEIETGDIVPVREGSTNDDTFWVQTATVNTVGTDSIDFALFGINPSNLVTISGSQTVTGAKTFNDLTLAGDMGAGSNKIINLLDPTSAQDAATKSYADGVDKGLQSVQVFTASGTWTKPAGINRVIIECLGGGGGGGGNAATGSGQATESGAGGGGGYASLLIDVSAIASEAVTIGAGGAGGAAGVNNGATGGTSSFGAHCSATAGSGGAGSVASSSVGSAQGGIGGTGTGGDYNIPGGDGGNGRVIGSSVVLSSCGGASALGQSSIESVATGVGVVGKDYGGGGSGSFAGPSSAAKAGASGADGIIIVYEYE